MAHKTLAGSPGNLLEAMHGIYGDEKYSDYVAGARPLIYPAHHFAWTFPTLMKPLPTVDVLALLFEEGQSVARLLEKQRPHLKV